LGLTSLPLKKPTGSDCDKNRNSKIAKVEDQKKLKDQRGYGTKRRPIPSDQTSVLGLTQPRGEKKKEAKKDKAGGEPTKNPTRATYYRHRLRLSC